MNLSERVELGYGIVNGVRGKTGRSLCPIPGIGSAYPHLHLY